MGSQTIRFLLAMFKTVEDNLENIERKKRKYNSLQSITNE